MKEPIFPANTRFPLQRDIFLRKEKKRKSVFESLPRLFPSAKIASDFANSANASSSRAAQIPQNGEKLDPQEGGGQGL